MKATPRSTMHSSMLFDRQECTDAELIGLFEGMLYPRMIEEKMLNLLRQGKISKWFSGIGQEAISVGAVMAVDPDVYLFPLHRNLGVFTCRGIELDRLIAQWQGKKSGFTNGRDRSFHFGSLQHHIVGMISHLGPQLALADGVALAHRLQGRNQVAIAFTGEGGASEGDFHEALNVASVWQLPVIFIIENNGYALSTPTSEQYRCEHLADRAIGYGMPSYILDGNNVLEIYQNIKKIASELKNDPHPVLIECKTFRMRGHEEASGTKYVPPALMQEWQSKDPLANYSRFLEEMQIVDEAYLTELRTRLKERINKAVDNAFSEQAVSANQSVELGDVYKPSVDLPFTDHPNGEKSSLRFIDAISQALDQGMSANEKLVLMGQDIGSYGGVFKVTDGLVSKYGIERVRNTPLCESAIIGIALGLTLEGYAAMVEMQFADFVTCGFNQIVNNLAKIHYRWGHAPNVTIRMPTGGNVGAGPFHSQSIEGWFFQVPGLKIIYPSNPYDAKGLLLASLHDPNPVLFFEHKFLYRSVEDMVPEEPYTIPFGKAALVREGELATIITYGLGVQWALETVAQLMADLEILDLRTLQPIDFDAIAASVKKTGKVIILHEATLTGNVGAEIAAYISEHLFESLDAPVIRCASLDTPVPFARDLEEAFLPRHRFKDQLELLLHY